MTFTVKKAFHRRPESVGGKLKNIIVSPTFDKGGITDVREKILSQIIFSDVENIFIDIFLMNVDVIFTDVYLWK